MTFYKKYTTRHIFECKIKTARQLLNLHDFRVVEINTER